jgi:hypothetical protein
MALSGRATGADEMSALSGRTDMTRGATPFPLLTLTGPNKAAPNADWRSLLFIATTTPWRAACSGCIYSLQ